MRGEDRQSGGLFSYVDLEARVPADHPLPPIRAIVDDALSALSGAFEAMYSHLGRFGRRMVDAEGANREGEVAGGRDDQGSWPRLAGGARCWRSVASGGLEAGDESEVVGDHR
jgi:hypothetical protein